MVVSILEFIKTGKFGTVELGQNTETIKRIFCKPDDISDMRHNMFIWRYGAFEFHFSDDILFLLWCDNLSYMFSPKKKQFKLDRWILDKYKDGLTLSKFIEAIKDEGIDYILKGTFYTADSESLLPDNVMLCVTGTDSIIYFEDPLELSTCIWEYQIIAIGSSSLKSNYKVRLL